MEHRLVTLLDAWGFTDVEINVVFFPGASVRRVVDRGMRTLDGRLLVVDLTYLSAGINELTVIQMETWFSYMLL